MKSFIKARILAVIVLFVILGVVGSSSAAGLIKPNVKDGIGNNAQSVGGTAGYEEGTADSALILIQTGISAFLGIIGILLLVYILYAGYNWMTAEGEEEKVTEAKSTIKRAITGLVIIIAAYAISVFVMSRLEVGILKGDGGGAGTVTPWNGSGGGAGMVDQL